VLRTMGGCCAGLYERWLLSLWVLGSGAEETSIVVVTIQTLQIKQSSCASTTVNFVMFTYLAALPCQQRSDSSTASAGARPHSGPSSPRGIGTKSFSPSYCCVMCATQSLTRPRRKPAVVGQRAYAHHPASFRRQIMGWRRR
jgi:hypothetical protein